MKTATKSKVRAAKKRVERDKGARAWSQMTADELETATKGFEDIRFEDTRPMSPQEQAVWERAKRGRGRPRNGKGAVRVLVTLEKQLKLDADELAKKKGIGRSELITQALQRVMASEATSPASR